MKRAEILIVGAGAAGLMAAKELAKSGKKVIILEARERIGGRIHSIEIEGCRQPVEGAAEFIHGNLPVTMQLMKEAGIGIYESGGQTYSSANNEIKSQDLFVEGWDLLMERLMEQKKDISIAQFLQENFSGNEYAELRKSLNGYIEGYDAADTHRASIFALRAEWTGEELTQYRPEGGYGKMIAYLERACKDAGVEIYLSTQVQTVQWKKGHVELISIQHELFAAAKVIITIPLGVLKAEPQSGGISFVPSLTKKINAVHALGFGAVIKFLALFKEPFWENYTNNNGKEIRMEEMGFLFSNAEVPTWWTQYPQKSSLLTGWLAGPRVEKLKDADIAELNKLALHSLSEIFQLSEEEIRSKLVTIEAINWAADPFTRGAYTYSTIDTPAAREEMMRSEENTIYFAGEALYEGAALGTVEAALASGLHTAREIAG